MTAIKKGKGHIEVVKVLLEHKADVNVTDEVRLKHNVMMRSPPLYSVFSSKPDVNTCSTLLCDQNR